MGDHDVIYVSSGDEDPHDESPLKKAKINYAPFTAKLEPKDKGKNTILCYLKRKSDDDTEKSIGNVIKKQKVEKNIVEEIIIESPIKNELPKLSTTINELSVEVLRDKVENGTISINKVTTKKPIELSKSANQPKSSYSKATIPPVKNYVQRQSTKTNSKESNGKNTTPSILRSKSISENADSIVVNPVAKLKDEAISKSSSSTMLRNDHSIFDGTDATAANEKMALAKSQIEISKVDSLSSKSEDERLLTSFAKPGNIVDTDENREAGSEANETDQHRDRNMTPPKESGDSLMIRTASDSPEVLILPRVDTPKASRAASDKTAVKALFTKSSNNASISEEKTLPNTENSTNDSAQSTSTSEIPCLTNCQILNDGPEDVLSETTDLIKSIKQTEGSPSVSTSEPGDTTTPSSKFEAGGAKIQTKNDGLAKRRITPQRVPEIMSKSNHQSNSDTEKTSKSVKNAESHNSKRSESDIANGHEKSMLNDKKHSTTKKECSSNNKLEAKTGCSKTPAEKKSSSLKRKSTSPEIAKKAKKKSDEDASKFEEFEPQPGCSKSPDEIKDGKPRLVVFDKKPVSLETEDTFSMFLSLCLQTDRSLDMEKVVAKLKRYYEQLNPAYAASQAFRDTLNEKRDLIMRKGKKVVYHYVQLLKEDMKAKKRIVTPVATAKEDEDGAKEEKDIADAKEGEEEENSEEARRVRQKIKRIEKAMKECQKMIKKYEEAEINFDDENNSHYIKLDRFKERMVELYTQMCKYTREHPDAGRAYLRPKHLRVTQIPSVDQAINSFINSKLSVNKNKVTKGKSFIDGLIFPDYVDILECVEKVNQEQDMKLSKRAMQNLAEKAFTQMGKHLQEARQNDYWDTFSLHLDNNVDPANSDSDLLEKLSHNKKIAEENEKKVFDEFVRRQEEGKAEDKDDSPSEGEDEDDVEDEEQEEEDEANGKKLNRDVESDEEMSVSEDTDRESAKEDNGDSLQAIETISEVPPNDEDEECTVEDDTEDISKNNNLEPSEATADKETKTPTPSPKDFAEKETMMIEVILDDVETEDGENEPQEEEKLQQPLRIRSFAKPPDSWQCSQEGNEEKNVDNTTKAETSEDAEEEISVVRVLSAREKYVQNVINNSTIIGNVPVKSLMKAVTASPTTKSKYPTVQSVNVPSTSTNTTSGRNPRYITIAPGVKRPVQLPPSRVQNNIQTTKMVAVSRSPQMPAINTKQVRVGVGAATSTPIQRTQLQIRPLTPLQQTNQLQVVRLSNGKCISATMASRAPNTPRYVTVAASSTAIDPPQTLPTIMRPVQISRGSLTGQILPGANSGQIRPQIVSWPRNSTPLSRGVTSTPIQQRPSYHQQNRVKIPVNLLPGAQSSQVQVLGVNNGKFMTSFTENSPISQQAERNASQQQQKVTNVTAPVKGVYIAPATTLPVLKPRINDNVQMVQQQKPNVPRAPRPGDQNRQSSEDGTKRKNELL